MEAWLTLREACPCVLGTSCRRHHYEPQGRSWVKQSKAPRELPHLHDIAVDWRKERTAILPEEVSILLCAPELDSARSA